MRRAKILSSGCKQIDARSGPLVMNRIKRCQNFLPPNDGMVSGFGCLFALIVEECAVRQVNTRTQITVRGSHLSSANKSKCRSFYVIFTS